MFTDRIKRKQLTQDAGHTSQLSPTKRLSQPAHQESPNIIAEYFSYVVQSMADSLIVVSPEGRISSVNPAALALLGYQEIELIGQPIERIFADGTFRGDGLETLREAGILRRGEKVFRAKDGSGIPVSYSGSVLCDHTGKVHGIVCVAHDVTKRKRMEDQLRMALERERELSQLQANFIAMASHEFRTPLAIIQSSVSLLRDYAERLDENKKQYQFEKIESQIHHMTSLLEDILTIGRIETRRVEFQPAQVDLNAFCLSIVEQFQETTDAHQLIYNCIGQPRPMMVDHKLMRQAITNLLSNAVKYSPSGSPVHLTLSFQRDAIMLTIRDHGIGIPEADQANLFEPFRRASNVGNISGTGLGLTICKHAVDLHGGEITAESVVGEGTTFTMTFPDNGAKGNQR
jgi:PAS domain S-box-containing protein